MVVEAPPTPVPEALKALVKRRPPSKKKQLEQSFIMTDVRVRRNRLTHKWAVVDNTDKVIFEADVLVLGNVTMEEVADEDCTQTRYACGHTERIETKCVRGWMKGKLLSTKPPTSMPESGAGAQQVTFTRNPSGDANYVPGFGYVPRPSGFSCTAHQLQGGTKLNTAGYVVLHDSGKATAYYPNQPIITDAETVLP